MSSLSYKDAGVDLELYEQAMQKLPQHMRRTQTPRVMPLTGGFAGLFRLDYNSRLFAKNYSDPVLVYVHPCWKEVNANSINSNGA